MSPGTTERRVLDNLREQAGLNSPNEVEPQPAAPRATRFRLTAVQGLMLALFLVVDACVLGLLYLMVTGRLGLPS